MEPNSVNRYNVWDVCTEPEGYCPQDETQASSTVYIYIFSWSLKGLKLNLIL